MATNQKKRAVVSYENMSEELAAAFAEKYPKEGDEGADDGGNTSSEDGGETLPDDNIAQYSSGDDDSADA